MASCGMHKTSPRRAAAERVRRRNLAHRWQAPPVEFAIAGPARTSPEEVLDVIGEAAGRPDLRQRLLSGKSRQGDDDTVCLFGDARLVPILASRASFHFLEGTASPSFFFSAHSRHGREGSLAGLQKAATPADKPVVAGPEGQRAFDDLANFNPNSDNWQSPWCSPENEMKLLASPSQAERAKQAKYVLATAAQSPGRRIQRPLQMAAVVRLGWRNGFLGTGDAQPPGRGTCQKSDRPRGPRRGRMAHR